MATWLGSLSARGDRRLSQGRVPCEGRERRGGSGWRKRRPKGCSLRGEEITGSVGLYRCSSIYGFEDPPLSTSLGRVLQRNNLQGVGLWWVCKWVCNFSEDPPIDPLKIHWVWVYETRGGWGRRGLGGWSPSRPSSITRRRMELQQWLFAPGVKLPAQRARAGLRRAKWGHLGGLYSGHEGQNRPSAAFCGTGVRGGCCGSAGGPFGAGRGS